jgi:hypothetical protein
MESNHKRGPGSTWIAVPVEGGGGGGGEPKVHEHFCLSERVV